MIRREFFFSLLAPFVPRTQLGDPAKLVFRLSEKDWQKITPYESKKGDVLLLISASGNGPLEIEKVVAASDWKPSATTPYGQIEIASMEVIRP